MTITILYTFVHCLIVYRCSFKIRDPEEDPIFEERIVIGAKTKELDYKIDKRGVYELCYELDGGRCAVFAFNPVTSPYQFTLMMLHIYFSTGITPVRVFFHVDYKPSTTDSRKVAKDDISTLDKQLEVMNTRIKEISQEIEHARKQEIAMKEAGGKLHSCFYSFLLIFLFLLS